MLGRVLKNPWIGTLLLALPGLLLLAAAVNFNRANQSHNLGLYFTMQHGMRLFIVAAIGSLLQAFGIRLLLRKRPEAAAGLSVLSAALPLTLGVAATCFCVYVAWQGQLFQAYLGDVTDSARLATLQAASLGERAPPATGGDWPQWRGPGRDGQSAE